MNNQTARSKSTWEIVHSQLKQKKFTFIDWVAYWRGQYGCSSPSTKVLHGYTHYHLSGCSSWTLTPTNNMQVSIIQALDQKSVKLL